MDTIIKTSAVGADAIVDTRSATRSVAIPWAAADDGEVTVYIKGFLSPGEAPDHFAPWFECHKALQSKLGWGPCVQGYCWPSGDFTPVSAPFATIARIGWDAYRRLRGVGRISPLSHVGFFLGEQVTLTVARFVRAYWNAREAARDNAGRLSNYLREMADRYDRVRVVAHSLGCMQVIDAVARLKPRYKPDEIHLCAAACSAKEVGDKLCGLAKAQTMLYFTPKDWVLHFAFRAVSVDAALGCVGPTEDYERLVPTDVSEYFGFLVHGQHKHRFAAFAGTGTSDAQR